MSINHGGFEGWAFAALIIVAVFFYAWGAAPGIPRIA